MCTLTTAAATAFIGTSAIDSYLNLKASNLASDEARFAASRAREEAAARRLVAASNLEEASFDADQALTDADLAAGELYALYGASGIRPDVGTPAAVGEEISARGAHDAETIRRRAELEAYLAGLDANRYEVSAGFASRRAASAAASGALNFANDLMRLGGSGYSLAERVFL